MTNIYVLNFHYTTLIEKENLSCIILTLYMHAVLQNKWISLTLYMMVAKEFNLLFEFILFR